LEQFFKKFKKFNLSYSVTIYTALVFSGCATLDLTLPIAELESPQHQGRLKGFGIEFIGLTGQQIQLTPDASARPLATATEKHNMESVFVTKPAINLYAWNRFTFTGGLVESKSPFLKMKVSLLSGFREDGEAGRYHASLGTEVSYQRAEKSGNQNGIGGPTGFPWSGTSDLLNGKVGMSIGYQYWKRFTPFIGYNYQQFQTLGSITQTPAGSDSGGKYTYQPEIGRIHTYGLGLDWKPSHALFIMPQVIVYKLKWYDEDISDIGGSLKIVYVPVQ
jgi:hypothetical protein